MAREGDTKVGKRQVQSGRQHGGRGYLRKCPANCSSRLPLIRVELRSDKKEHSLCVGCASLASCPGSPLEDFYRERSFSSATETRKDSACLSVRASAHLCHLTHQLPEHTAAFLSQSLIRFSAKAPCGRRGQHRAAFFLTCFSILFYIDLLCLSPVSYQAITQLLLSDL